MPPLEPLLLCEEPTYEGLVKLLAAGQPSVGLFSDEGGRFIGGHGMNPDNLLKTAAGMSGLWDGKPVDRVRGGDGATKLYGRRVSCHLMVQPEDLAVDAFKLNIDRARAAVSLSGDVAGIDRWNTVLL